tara:strand:+ start:65 stop:268 length:204 start_codon:yes stop_codon:yes gene_type:complete
VESSINDIDHSLKQLQVSCQSRLFVKKALDYTQKIIFHAISPLKAPRGMWPLQKELSTIEGLFLVKS